MKNQLFKSIVSSAFVLSVATLQAQDPIVRTCYTTDLVPLVHDGMQEWHILTNAMAIGDAVGEPPTGNFKDAIGKPLANGNWIYIDSIVFLDDDKKAYLYRGNQDVFYVKLNDDMILQKGNMQRADYFTSNKSIL